MAIQLENTLVVAIASTALFDMTESHAVFESQGLEAFQCYQLEREAEVLLPGGGFALVNKLLKLNEMYGRTVVEVILLSRNSADTGLRVFNSIEHYGLKITRAAFCGGVNPHRYVAAFSANLFLSTNVDDVRYALGEGIAAATLLPVEAPVSDESCVKIAFDGDAVLFSDVSEQIFQQKGLDAFTENEKQAALDPLPGGPFKSFLAMLHDIQKSFPADECPIRTALVTARAAPAHERVIRTLRAWGIRIDESLFLGGLDKGPFLKAFAADVFFDDQQGHCDSASKHVSAGHVPYGVSNKQREA